MHAADTGLSVDDAVDVAREAADFVLLERDLDVISAFAPSLCPGGAASGPARDDGAREKRYGAASKPGARLKRRTKILATIGPASREPALLDALLAAGLDAVRLNFSHGTHEQHAETCARVRAAAVRAGREVAVLQDLQGPNAPHGRHRRGVPEREARRALRLCGHSRRRRSC